MPNLLADVLNRVLITVIEAALIHFTRKLFMKKA